MSDEQPPIKQHTDKIYAAFEKYIRCLQHMLIDR